MSVFTPNCLLLALSLSLSGISANELSTPLSDFPPISKPLSVTPMCASTTFCEDEAFSLQLLCGPKRVFHFYQQIDLLYVDKDIERETEKGTEAKTDKWTERPRQMWHRGLGMGYRHRYI